MTGTAGDMRDLATISVIMACRNPGAYLEAALDSALRQLGPGDEVVVQDAASTDGSTAILDRVARRDARLRFLSEPDDGQSDALNRCLRRARGGWCIWLNADDVLVTGAVDAVRGAMNRAVDADLIVGGNRIIRADGSLVDHYPGRRLSVEHGVTQGCCAFSGSIVMRTAFLRGVGGFDDALHTVMDLELQLRMVAADPVQVVIPEEIGALRFHEASKSANRWATFVLESHRVRLGYARTTGERLRAGVRTATHAGERVVFRVRLTPGYRLARRRLREWRR